MEDIKIISSEEDIKIFADVNRFAIMDCLALHQLLTTTQISAKTGLTYSKVSYSLKKLEEVGMVKVAETRLTHGIQERYYSLTAREYRILPYEKDDSKNGNYKSNYQIMDEVILKSLFKEYLNNTYKQGMENNNKVRSGKVNLGNVYLKEEEFEMINEKINSYFTELLEPYKHKKDEGSKVYTIANLFFRRE